MGLLSDSDIASMRATLSDSLPGTAVLKTATFADDSGGGGSITWTAAGTVPCRITPMSMDERLIANRIAEDANWLITLPADTAVNHRQRLAIDGRSFEVLAVRAPRSYEISRQVEANEVS